MLNKGLTTSQDPPIHDVLAFWRIVTVDKLFPRSSLVQLDLAKVKVEGIDPFQQDVCQDFSDTLFSESEIITPNDRRVDEEKSDGIGSVFTDNLEGVGVILQFFTHFLSVTTC
jgi:hypothetical protein